MSEAGSLKQCFGKKRYATLDFAESMAAKLTTRFGKQHRVYSCALCRGYHCSTGERR